MSLEKRVTGVDAVVNDFKTLFAVDVDRKLAQRIYVINYRASKRLGYTSKQAYSNARTYTGCALMREYDIR